MKRGSSLPQLRRKLNDEPRLAMLRDDSKVLTFMTAGSGPSAPVRLGEPCPFQLLPLTPSVVLKAPSSGSSTRKLTPALPRPSPRHIAVERSFERFRYACLTLMTRPALASIRLETSAAHEPERLRSSRDILEGSPRGSRPAPTFLFNSVQDLAHPFAGSHHARPSRPSRDFFLARRAPTRAPKRLAWHAKDASSRSAATYISKTRTRVPVKSNDSRTKPE
jgi:hypothetical protein